MPPGTKYPGASPGFRVFPLPEPDPSPTFNTRPIPETRHATRGYPPGTRLGKICWFFDYFSPKFQKIWLFSPFFQNFWLLFSAKFSKFLPTFSETFEIFGYFPTNFRNFWLFSRQNFEICQNSRNLIPDGYPGTRSYVPEPGRAGIGTTRTRPDHSMPEPTRSPTFCYPGHH